ncbi:phage shock protein PspC (stress-responsive transcriptional regulator)/multisubunit Na+/H+ antiporter MnhG subunit [Pedobacter sp. AK017]|uniref:PspC domain-containing protein n=1 Tax=Pedobacter sp. AK017 TaxID=2723073 RepID=UPI00160A447C|nr:PspC domain-containing protein [Pedobacter sp. AK017]MBB5440818.1 phage shock protein PspC (stress-responsive transcriptional regulator)/multisubunit Na+/H+ antiporter MnhG subunit [Pedobacter sp. AK017]
MEKRLFRNEHDKVIAGVSSGVAEYMEVDVTIIRLLFVLSTIFLVGTGILVYVIMWIVVPVNNDPAARFSKFNEFFKGQQNPFQASNPFEPQKKTTENTGPFQNRTSSGLNDTGVGNESFESWKKSGDFKPYKKNNNETGRTVAGLFLLVIGVYFFMDEFDLIPFHFQLTKLWPLVFVAIGASFIIRAKNKNAWENWKEQNMQPQENSGNTADAPGANVNPVKPEDPDASEGNTGSSIDFTKKEI